MFKSIGLFTAYCNTRGYLRKMAKRKIPDRWEDYSDLGNQIEGTRFITFKVPLKPNLCNHLSKDEQFTPHGLLKKLEERDLKLGLVIDLTNTTRYYNPHDFMNKGDIQYEKIFTEGHVVPKKNVRSKFFDVVDNYLESNKDNDKLIGVHCTHGLNRTGYLVCRYMIDKLEIKPDDAIVAYNVARGHEIERENYLEDLRTNNSIDAEDDEADSNNGYQQRGGPHRFQNRHNNQFRERRSRGGGFDSGPWRNRSDRRGRGRDERRGRRTHYERNDPYMERQDSGHERGYGYQQRDGDYGNYGQRNQYGYEGQSWGQGIQNGYGDGSEYGSFGRRHGRGKRNNDGDGYGSYGRRNYQDGYGSYERRDNQNDDYGSFGRNYDRRRDGHLEDNAT